MVIKSSSFHFSPLFVLGACCAFSLVLLCTAIYSSASEARLSANESIKFGLTVSSIQSSYPRTTRPNPPPSSFHIHPSNPNPSPNINPLFVMASSRSLLDTTLRPRPTVNDIERLERAFRLPAYTGDGGGKPPMDGDGGGRRGNGGNDPEIRKVSQEEFSDILSVWVREAKNVESGRMSKNEEALRALQLSTANVIHLAYTPHEPEWRQPIARFKTSFLIQLEVVQRPVGLVKVVNVVAGPYKENLPPLRKVGSQIAAWLAPDALNSAPLDETSMRRFGLL